MIYLAFTWCFLNSIVLLMLFRFAITLHGFLGKQMDANDGISKALGAMSNFVDKQGEFNQKIAEEMDDTVQFKKQVNDFVSKIEQMAINQMGGGKAN